MPEQLSIIVLAGGEGTRLAPLTRALYGTDLPKQFAVLAGDRSLLQQTVARALRLTEPERVCVVVSAHQQERARAQLTEFPGVELIAQPRNLDTAPAILFPLARIRCANPHARVCVLPADHYFEDEAPLLHAIRHTGYGAARTRVNLIGVAPDHLETEYGWIDRGAELGHSGSFAVRAFQEKPDQHAAEVLHARGALWNTFISVGPVSAYWRLARQHLPLHTAMLDRYLLHRRIVGERMALESLYRDLPAANFSRELLARARGLAVVPVAGTGWSDWGSPARVFESLAGKPEHGRLVARLAGPKPTIPAMAPAPSPEQRLSA
jgi:mannose-1-phosphate guanylyltransferase